MEELKNKIKDCEHVEFFENNKTFGFEVDCSKFASCEEMAEALWWNDMELVHSSYDGDLYIRVYDTLFQACGNLQYCGSHLWEEIQNKKVLFTLDTETLDFYGIDIDTLLGY